ncbi:hypothetical protein [Clostridium sp. LP20]|uniref:hypothetical protein n=1 Tax=Clostridium sp. LP20 TaxID=3418665 RepID=UPI003EE49FEC
MQLIINTILILVLIANIIMDIKKIKSNKELSSKLDERNKLLKESVANEEKVYKEYVKTREHFEELKSNTSLDYDHLTEEVIERINKLQRSNGNIKLIIKP